MDYTSWCDEILSDLATWLKRQPYGLDGHLDTFTQQFLTNRDLAMSGQEAVSNAVLDVFGAFGLPDDDKRLHMKYEQLIILTNAYGRWQAIFNTQITESERSLTEAINRLSINEDEGVFWVSEVREEHLMKDEAVQNLLRDFPEDHIREMLDGLNHRKLIAQLKWLGGAEYTGTYCGYTRLNRTHIIADREIDELRLKGESDSLDYKRVLNVTSKKGKTDFVNDVVAFANTGGTSVKHILVGVEDDGSFPQPDDPEAHQQLVHSLKDTTLQQIISERTVHAPSVTIKSKGMHREGPYVLIEIKGGVGNVPYRFFPNPADSREPGATTSGEVWVRKGTTKHLASPDETADLERRAELYRQTFPGQA